VRGRRERKGKKKKGKKKGLTTLGHQFGANCARVGRKKEKISSLSRGPPSKGKEGRKTEGSSSPPLLSCLPAFLPHCPCVMSSCKKEKKRKRRGKEKKKGGGVFNALAPRLDGGKMKEKGREEEGKGGKEKKKSSHAGEGWSEA